MLIPTHRIDDGVLSARPPPPNALPSPLRPIHSTEWKNDKSSPRSGNIQLSFRNALVRKRTHPTGWRSCPCPRTLWVSQSYRRSPIVTHVLRQVFSAHAFSVSPKRYHYRGNTCSDDQARRAGTGVGITAQ